MGASRDTWNWENHRWLAQKNAIEDADRRIPVQNVVDIGWGCEGSPSHFFKRRDIQEIKRYDFQSDSNQLQFTVSTIQSVYKNTTVHSFKLSRILVESTSNILI